VNILIKFLFISFSFICLSFLSHDKNKVIIMAFAKFDSDG